VTVEFTRESADEGWTDGLGRGRVRRLVSQGDYKMTQPSIYRNPSQMSNLTSYVVNKDNQVQLERKHPIQRRERSCEEKVITVLRQLGKVIGKYELSVSGNVLTLRIRLN